MTVSTICPKCRRIRPCACPTTSQHKIAKARVKKYTSSRWQKTRKLALARDGYRCRTCGQPGTVENPLTVDLLVGDDHSKAALKDCVTRCRICHGRKDGGKPRARRAR